MNISKSKHINENYAAQIIKVKNLRKATPKADKLKAFTFQGNNILSSSVQEEDIVVYFPVECQISPKILSSLNQYRKAERNADGVSTGFFEDTGRVKALKLLGVASEGFVIRLSEIYEVFNEKYDESSDHLKLGLFDTINGEIIVQKYVIKQVNEKSTKEGKSRDKKKPKQSRMVDEQFKLHRDTPKLVQNIHRLTENPDQIIYLTWKLHGTSFVSSKVKTKKKLNIMQHIFKWLGADIKTEEYSNVYSSRKVIKNEFFEEKQHNHYYKEDIWKEANDKIKDELLKGETVYGEIVGYLKSGGMIQKDYDYGCKPGEFKIYIYRITHTNDDGKIVELSYDQVAERAEQLGVEAVPLIWKGNFKNLYELVEFECEDKILEVGKEEAIISWLKENYVRDQNSVYCKNKVPEEGICLTINNLKMNTFKLKSFAFLCYESKALDKGIFDIESHSHNGDN